MILFSQGPTAHSRLGNSLVWMSKVHFWMSEFDFISVFPWAIQNYSSYFDSSSVWIKSNVEADVAFNSKFGMPLTAKNISLVSRGFERDYEISKGLAPFEWDAMIIPSKDKSFLYLAGDLDLTNSEVINLVKEHKFTICHEPYNFKFDEDENYKGQDFNVIAPKISLYKKQLDMVQSLSKGKANVGLHIRRGDYSRWKDGIYYYSDDFWIEKTVSLIEEDCVVWIFSNDLSEKLSGELEALGAIITNEDFETEFVKMMCMDKLIGPPSTFSGMASKISSKVFAASSKLIELPPLK